MISTTGQGDLPENSKAFWKSILRKKLSVSVLSDVSFTLFGLGDSSYPKFNWAALKLYKRLTQLGAQEFYRRGESDEQHEEGRDAAFIPWLSDLRQTLLQRFPLPTGVQPIPDDQLLSPKWLLSLDLQRSQQETNEVEDIRTKVISSRQRAHGKQELRSNLGHNELEAKQTLDVVLEDNRRVTPKQHWQDVRLLTFRSHVKSHYNPGDVLTIHPHNSSESVDELISRMQWVEIAGQPIRFQAQLSEEQQEQQRMPLPPVSLPDSSPCSFRDILFQSLDITAIPRRSFFSLIANFTSDHSQRDRILEFTKPEYVDELYDYTTRPRRSILEVLQEFDSVQIPWEWAPVVFPPLRGRQFSIASGGKLKTSNDGFTKFELLIAIVKYKTVIKKVREGVCTRYLANLAPAKSIEVTLHRGGLGTLRDLQRPLLLIGPGTGIAPIRSLIYERASFAEQIRAQEIDVKSNTRATTSLKPVLLFFGCRNEDADYFFKEEWSSLSRSIPLQIFPAFSRDERQKVYVQDKVREQAATVSDLLQNHSATVYICGSSGKMPQAVRAALLEALREFGNSDESQAKKILERIEKEGRYKQETW